MAREYIENKSQRNKGLDGLARGIEHPKKALKIVKPHQKDEFDADFQEDMPAYQNAMM